MQSEPCLTTLESIYQLELIYVLSHMPASYRWWSYILLPSEVCIRYKRYRCAFCFRQRSVIYHLVARSIALTTRVTSLQWYLLILLYILVKRDKDRFWYLFYYTQSLDILPINLLPTFNNNEKNNTLREFITYIKYDDTVGLSVVNIYSAL